MRSRVRGLAQSPSPMGIGWARCRPPAIDEPSALSRAHPFRTPPLLRASNRHAVCEVKRFEWTTLHRANWPAARFCTTHPRKALCWPKGASQFARSRERNPADPGAGSTDPSTAAQHDPEVFGPAVIPLDFRDTSTVTERHL